MAQMTLLTAALPIAGSLTISRKLSRPTQVERLKPSQSVKEPTIATQAG